MKGGRRGGMVRIALTSVLLTLLLVAFLIVPLASSGSFRGEFSAYEAGWQGTSDARELVADQAGMQAANVGSSPLVLKDVDAGGAVLVIAGMERPYGSAEEDALESFMLGGGTIILLDDYGYGDAFAKHYNIHYLKRPLRDQAFERNQSFVRVLAQVGDNSYQVLLNDPSALQDLDGNRTDLDPIIVSSTDSFLDLNNNGVIDVVDKQGPFNVGIRRDVGVSGGSLIVMSDSGFINNDMLSRQENKEYFLALLGAALDDGGLVLFDESRRTSTQFEIPIYATEKGMLALFRAIPSAGVLFTAGFLAIAVLAVVRLPGRKSWLHRHLPGAFVGPPERLPEKELLHVVLQTKLEMEGGTTNDATLRNALDGEGDLDPRDIEVLIKHLAHALAIEMPDDAPPADPTNEETHPIPA